MKYRYKNPKLLILIPALVFAILIISDFFGEGTIRSGIRIGYSGTDGRHSWSGKYARLNGSMKHTIRPKTSPSTLHIEVTTKKGTLSIEIKDASKSVIFSADNIGTNSFDIPVSGKSRVHIKADNHTGSFDFHYLQPKEE